LFLVNDLQQNPSARAADSQAAVDAFSGLAFADGALPAKTKELIAVAVVHVTRGPSCITGQTPGPQCGAKPHELMEAIWVAAEMAGRRRLRLFDHSGRRQLYDPAAPCVVGDWELWPSRDKILDGGGVDY
jgi:AhpD family alkylhydroperoxidase